MASIIDIAEKANVGVSTVSRVINGYSNVAPETARAVQEAVKALDYKPRTVRPGPKTHDRQGIRTGMILFLSVHPVSPEEMYNMPAYPALLSGIQRTLHNKGLELVLAHCPDANTVPPVLRGNRIDGVLLFGQQKLGDALEKALAVVPSVWCFRSPVDQGRMFDHVFYDNSLVGKIAADYLVDSGHRHLAFVNCWPIGGAHDQRRDKFLETVYSRGASAELIEPPENPPPEKKLQTMQKLTRRVMDLSPSPTGMFCPADDMMVSVFNTLQKKGIEPGRDIELIGCNNDLPYMEQMHPRPATIDLRLAAVGEGAVKQLLKRMANPDAEEREENLIKPMLIAAEKKVTPEVAKDGTEEVEVGIQSAVT